MEHLAICLDVDGTIVDASGNLFADAISFERTRMSGGLLGLCSARPLASLRKIAGYLGGVDFLIGLQGAVGTRYSVVGEFSMWSVPLVPTDVSRLERIASTSLVEAWLYTQHEWHCSENTRMVERESQIIQVMPCIGKDIHEPILKVSFVTRNLDSLHRLDVIEQQLKSCHSLRISRSHRHMLEIVSSSTGASKGADRLSNGLDLPALRIAAIGDSYNDVGLLRIAEFPYTFRGAPAADLVPSAEIVNPPDHGGLLDIVTSILNQLNV